MGKRGTRWEATRQGGSNSCLFPALICSTTHQLLSATSKWTVVAGKKRKGKLSQDPGFLYILLPEQRREERQERDPGSRSFQMWGSGMKKYSLGGTGIVKDPRGSEGGLAN